MTHTPKAKPPQKETSARLTYDDKQIDFPVLVGTENEHGLDIGRLLSDTGLITLDHGYVNTGHTESAITY
ncbi:MAG: hypothetical protein KDA99_08320 [Planctomycetales bacterium]|nr:hypothetical protein [Planctomycetales bacterium]